MKHFRITNGEIRAIDIDQEHLIEEEWVELTESELENALRIEPSPKQSRDQAFAALVHDFGDGRVIQCRPHPFSDESNMRNAIEQMGRLGQTERLWFGADDTAVSVTAADLQAAIESGQDQSAVIWDEFFTAISG